MDRLLKQCGSGEFGSIYHRSATGSKENRPVSFMTDTASWMFPHVDLVQYCRIPSPECR
jgi:hypothetical protein